MAGRYGVLYSITDPLARAPGIFANAKTRRWRNRFNLADADIGGTTNPLILARLKKGMSPPSSVTILTSANLSGINVSLGIIGVAARYAAAQAGPNATSLGLLMTTAGQAEDDLTGDVDIILTPSGNWPGAGTLVTNLFASHR